MSAAGDPPIIITGGSVHIEFEPRDFAGGGNGRFSNDQKVIKRVEITGAGVQTYDSTATGNDITIRVTYGTP
jgi:hypothetical protein